jgi:hypothetical protein
MFSAVRRQVPAFVRPPPSPLPQRVNVVGNKYQSISTA